MGLRITEFGNPKPWPEPRLFRYRMRMESGASIFEFRLADRFPRSRSPRRNHHFKVTRTESDDKAIPGVARRSSRREGRRQHQSYLADLCVSSQKGIHV